MPSWNFSVGNAVKWAKGFFESDDKNSKINEDQVSNADSDKDSVLDVSNDYENMFQELMRRNTAFHNIMTAFSVLLADESGKLAHLREESRELLHWALQQREAADKFKEGRRRDFIGVMEAIAERLAARVELLAAEKDWLLGKQSEQETLRDELMRTRNNVLRQVLKGMQTEFFNKLHEQGVEKYIAHALPAKNGGKKPPSAVEVTHHNKFYSEAEAKLIQDFWKQLIIANEVISDGEGRMGSLSAAEKQLATEIETDKKHLSDLQQQMDVIILRFVSENDNLLHGARVQLDVVELLNDIRHLQQMVEKLQNEIMTLKHQRTGVEVGLEVLRSEDVDLGRAVCEFGKFLRFMDTITAPRNIAVAEV